MCIGLKLLVNHTQVCNMQQQVLALYEPGIQWLDYDVHVAS